MNTFNEFYLKKYKKEFDCLKSLLEKDGYDLSKQTTDEKSKLYNNDYKIVKTFWNSLPSDEVDIAIFGTLEHESRKSACIAFENKKKSFKYLNFEILTHNSIAEYYFDEKEGTLHTFLYDYDTFKPTSKK